MENSPNKQRNNQPNQKERSRASRSRYDNNKRDNNKLYPQVKTSNTDESRAAKSINSVSGDRIGNQNQAKGRENPRYSDKSRENRDTQNNTHDKAHFNKSKQTYKSGQNSSYGNKPRYGRSSGRSTNRNEFKERAIKTKHIETVEDILADIERIDKDIQFEIKQIKTIKLGL